jgi:hypothetical protein
MLLPDGAHLNATDIIGPFASHVDREVCLSLIERRLKVNLAHFRILRGPEELSDDVLAAVEKYIYWRDRSGAQRLGRKSRDNLSKT